MSYLQIVLRYATNVLLFVGTFFCIGRYWFVNSQDEQALLLVITFPRDEFELSMHSFPLLDMNPYFSETLHQSGVQ